MVLTLGEGIVIFLVVAGFIGLIAMKDVMKAG